MRPNLTATLAVRFEAAGNPTCGRNCFARPATAFEGVTHDATQPYTAAIQTGLNNAFRDLSNVVVQPRVGLAYNLNSKTVLRGGVGTFADQFQGNLSTRFFTNVPNVTSFTTTDGTVAPGAAGSVFALAAASNAAFQTGFGNGSTVAQLNKSVPGFAVPNVATQANTFYIPTYLEWNLEVQRELTSHVSWSENYVGNHGWHEYNQTPFPNAWSPSGFGGLPTTVPDSRFGEVLQLTSTGHSSYNGLTSSVKFRTKSLQGQLAYTWSHNLDTCSNNCLGRFNLGTAPSLRYQFNPSRMNYGNADYDVRHSFSANYVWMIPVHFTNPELKTALGGWSIGGTFMAHSGYPFTVTHSSLRAQLTRNTSGLATLAVPLDWLGGTQGSCNSPDVACLKTSQFIARAKQTDFGNLARNSFRGPGYFDTDLTVNKTITAKERLKVVVGANLFNVLNHPNFDLPVAGASSGIFGQIISTVGPASSAYGAFQGSAVSGRIVVLNTKISF